MVTRTPRTVFVIVAAAGILSGTFVASAAQGEQRGNLALLAAAESTARTTTPSGMPTVAGFYMLPDDNATGLRVSFVQKADRLTATWMTQQGDIYGRGTYRWDPVTGSFKGTSTTRYLCLSQESKPSVTVLVSEELYVLNDRELRDRYTKPLSVDCSVGVMQIFRWVDQTWLATDKDWRPLHPRQDSSEILIGAR